jgi:hypothetical protein
MRFEWDESKAAANRAKHGVSFGDALTGFDDPFALVARDDAHSTPDEERRWLIGGGDTAVFVVVFTVREEGNLYRLISARRAGRRERSRYEYLKGISVR